MKVKKSRTVALGAALVLLGILAAQPAEGGQTAPTAVPLVLRWVDLETGEVVDCKSPQGPGQAALCLEKTPVAPGPIVSSDEGDVIVGWWSRTVYSDYIAESCGRYRAQEGYYNCQIPFGGGRKVLRLGLIVCACSDPEYTPTGIIHNDDIEGEIMYWGAYKNNSPIGQSYETCWHYEASNPWTAGMTGGIHNNDAHNNYYCFTRLTDVKGTWGIYVDYQKTPDDADKQTGSKPVYGKRAQVNR